MKYFILAMCGTMTVRLLIGTFLYENHEVLSHPYENINNEHSNETDEIDVPEIETLQPVSNDI